jgi:Dna[CI] antecedent, DciA
MTMEHGCWVLPKMRFVTRQQILRYQLVSDWRGADDGPLNDCPLRTLGELVPEVMKGWRLHEKLREEDVAAAWIEIVGGMLARDTAPDGLKRGVLTIRVLQPAVHHELMMRKRQLVAKLQERFGKDELKDVKFRHG